MLYHTQDEWLNLLTDALQRPVVWDTAAQWLHQMFCDFETLGYPDDAQWCDPLMLRFKDWVIQARLLFSHDWLLKLDTIQDGDQYQRVGDLAVRLSDKLGLPTLHPGYAPMVNFTNPRTIVFHTVQRLASWQAPEAHRNWLQTEVDGWGYQALTCGLAAAWPLFLHYLQWGIVPATWAFHARDLLHAPDKWQALSVEGGFILWSYLQRASRAAVTPTTWRNWVSTLPPDHAAHTLDVPRAFQAYNLWATLQTPGQPPNWLSLVPMLEPAVAPTGENPGGNLAL